jgi:Ca2+-binding RTX toxin-like protein
VAAYGVAVAGGLLAAGMLSGVPAVGAGATCDGLKATLVGTAGDDLLTGTKGADIVAGLGGDDRIEALGGDDLICGGDGADIILGGRGNDRIYGGRDRLDHNAAGSFLVGDLLEGGPGDDWLNPTYDSRKVTFRQRPDAFSFADAETGVAVDLRGTSTSPGLGTATGDGTDTLVLGPQMRVVGSSSADQLTGSKGSDEIVGGPGSDVISARGGDDLVFPDEESVTADVPGNDLVRLGAGRDFVSSLAGRDQINAGRGDDRVEAFSPEPTSVRLGAGDDYLGQSVVPGNGTAMSGGLGEDLLMLYGGHYAGSAPAPRRVVAAAAGTLTTPAGAGAVGGFESYRLADHVRWKFLGTDLTDVVWAIDGGGLVARTRGGDDRITGSPLEDRIDGGTGRDTAYGRDGVDTCTHVEAGDCR